MPDSFSTRLNIRNEGVMKNGIANVPRRRQINFVFHLNNASRRFISDLGIVSALLGNEILGGCLDGLKPPDMNEQRLQDIVVIRGAEIEIFCLLDQFVEREFFHFVLLK